MQIPMGESERETQEGQLAIKELAYMGIVTLIDRGNGQSAVVPSNMAQEYINNMKLEQQKTQFNLDWKVSKPSEMTTVQQEKEITKKQVNGIIESILGTKKQNSKVGPNDKCPCGSGKKYKKCHGR
jgi:hypothetical protein